MIAKCGSSSAGWRAAGSAAWRTLVSEGLVRGSASAGVASQYSAVNSAGGNAGSISGSELCSWLWQWAEQEVGHGWPSVPAIWSQSAGIDSALAVAATVFASPVAKFGHA